MSMRAIVFGGSGLIGQSLLRQLATDSFFPSVTAIHRRSIDVPSGVDQEIMPLEEINSLERGWKDAVVFVALGTTMAKAGSKDKFRHVDHDLVVGIAEAARKHGAAQLHIVSALGADKHSRIFYNRVKGEMETAVEGCKLPVTYIYQPSILDGPRQEKRTGEQIGLALIKFIKPLLIGPLRSYRAIHIDQVAKAILYQAKHAQPGFHRIASQDMQRFTIS